MKMKLTQRTVENAKVTDKAYEISDTELRGLLLRVQPSGTRTFYVVLARHVRVRLGSFPVMPVSLARTQAQARLGRFATGERPDAKREAITFGDFLTERYGPWLTTKRKTGARTITTLETMFPELLNKPLSAVTAWAVERHMASRLKSGTNPATVNRDLNRVKAAMSKATEWKLLPDNPLRSVKRADGVNAGRVRYLSAAESAALRKALAAREAKHRARRNSGDRHRAARGKPAKPMPAGYVDHLEPMIVLSLHTGLRRGELTSITWADVSFENKMLTVRAAYAKSGKQRYVPLNSEALAVLKTWRKQHGDPGRVFPILDAKNAWAALLVDAEIEDFRWHDLRHCFASNLVMAGVDLNTVRELLGHSDMSMTLRYSHLAPEHMADAVEKLVR